MVVLCNQKHKRNYIIKRDKYFMKNSMCLNIFYLHFWEFHGKCIRIIPTQLQLLQKHPKTSFFQLQVPFVFTDPLSPPCTYMVVESSTENEQPTRATLLKKNLSPSSSSLGKSLVSPSHSLLTGFILCRCQGGTHSCCEFMSGVAPSQAKGTNHGR